MIHRLAVFWVLLVMLTVARNCTAQYVAEDPESWDGKAAVGDGECVALVKKAAGAPALTKDWKKGDLVKDGKNIKKGTAIATFDGDKYSGHAALYLSQDKDGIQVVDQWAERKDGDKVIRKAQPPHRRTIRWDGKGVSDNGSLFYVVK